MSFIEALHTAAADILNTIGVDAVFTSAAGDVDCKVDIVKDVDFEPFGVEAQVWGKGITAEAILSVIGKEPDRGDTFMANGTAYTVQSIRENDSLTVVCVVK